MAGLSPNDLFRVLLKTQANSVAQAQRNREASAKRIARLEDAILLLSVKQEDRWPFTTNICNSSQKENVKLGWAKHIPDFTENGQK
jgi:hypothetical protein